MFLLHATDAHSGQNFSVGAVVGAADGSESVGRCVIVGGTDGAADGASLGACVAHSFSYQNTASSDER